MLEDFVEYAVSGYVGGDKQKAWDEGMGYVDLGAAIMRACAGKNKLPMYALITDAVIRGKAFVNLMNGVRELLLWTYSPIKKVGPTWAGNEAAVIETADLTRMLAKFEDTIAAATLPRAPVALLFSSASDMLFQIDGKNSYIFKYGLRERQRIYLALRHSYIPVDVVSEQQILQDAALQNYQVLMVTDPNVPVEVQKKIKDWVKNDGGRLWAEVCAARWDEYNQPCGILDEVLGVKNREIVPLINKDQITWNKSGSAVTIDISDIRLNAIQTNAGVLGTYSDGQPAILHNWYGKGEAMLVGALMGKAYTEKHYTDWGTPNWSFTSGQNERDLISVMTTELQLPFILSVPGIYATLMDAPHGKLLWMLNGASIKNDNPPPPPFVTVTMQIGAKTNIVSVVSARCGTLLFQMKGLSIIFQLPLYDTDIVLVTTYPDIKIPIPIEPNIPKWWWQWWWHKKPYDTSVQGFWNRLIGFLKQKMR